MGDGKYFEIRSKLSDKVLTIDDDHDYAGQRVNLQRSKRNRGQLWFEDDLTGRIRSFKNDDLVLEIEDDHLIVNEFHMDEYNQNWKLAGDTIRHAEDSDLVLDVTGYEKRENADVAMYSFHGNENQQWEFDYEPRKYFHIRSQMNQKVVDIAEGNPDEGAELLMWNHNEDIAPNQLWWEDKWGNIRSKLNDFTFFADPGQDLYMKDYDSEFSEGLWAKSGKKIYNKADPEMVIDIKGSDGDNGARLTKWNYEGTDNQHWEFVFI